MKIIDKHRCINNDPEHQNNLSDNLYYEPVSKDPRGPEGPEASPLTDVYGTLKCICPHCNNEWGENKSRI